MKAITFLLCCIIYVTLNAQYSYSVQTIIPENSKVLNDGLSIDESGTVYGSYWGIWQGAVGRHILRYRTNGTYDTLATGLSRPNGISYHDGKIYVANASSGGQLVIIDTMGAKEVFANVPGISNVIPVPETDSLVATSWGGNVVYGISSNGSVRTVQRSPLFNGPVGACYGPSGALYVGNFTDGKIIKVENGNASIFADLGGGIGFLTYSDSSILATNHTDKKVYKISIDGSSEPQVIAGSGKAIIEDGIGLKASFRSPNGIVSTPSGDTIYISEFAGNALRMIVRIPIVVKTKDSLKDNPNIKIYPNPARDHIRLKNTPINSVKKGILFDAKGNTIRIINNAEIENSILTSSLKPGAYVLRLLGFNEGDSKDLRFMIH